MNIVPVSRTQRLALKAAPLSEVAQSLLGSIPEETPGNEFPAVPVPLEANAETQASFVNLGKIFNQVVPVSRRSLSEAEIATIGQEYTDIANILDLLKARKEQIKEIIQSHQDVDAEETNQAFVRDVIRNGSVLATATPRDDKGHYLLAAPRQPVVTEIPGSSRKFSNEYRSGRTTTDLEQLTRDFENGDLDEATYKAVTKVVRVVDAEKLRAHVLKTGNVSLLARVLKKGRDGVSFYLRGRKK